MKGKNGFIAWKNFGVNWIGNVPPEPPICITSRTIPNTLPTFPNTEHNEYKIIVNITLVNTLPNTNNPGFTQYIFNNYKSPKATIIAWIIAMLINNIILPKYCADAEYSPLASTLSIDDSNNNPTHNDNTV